MRKKKSCYSVFLSIPKDKLKFFLITKRVFVWKMCICRLSKTFWFLNIINFLSLWDIHFHRLLFLFQKFEHLPQNRNILKNINIYKVFPESNNELKRKDYETFFSLSTRMSVIFTDLSYFFYKGKQNLVRFFYLIIKLFSTY